MAYLIIQVFRPRIFCRMSCVVGISFVLLGANGFATECEGGGPFIVEEIVIRGNQNTKSDVIRREVGIVENQSICTSELKKASDRVRRTGLFSSINLQLTPKAPDRVVVDVNVVEKWTTIPIFKINSGGGVTQYTIGVFDPNVFGSFQEAGIQYENLAGASSGVLWYKNPRLFDKRQGLDLQYWNIRRVRTKYDPASESAVIMSGYLHKREKIFAEYFREVEEQAKWKISLDYNHDEFSDESLPENLKEKWRSTEEKPAGSKFLILSSGIELGVVDGEAQMLRGSTVSFNLGYAAALELRNMSFVEGDIKWIYHKPIDLKWQYAQRLNIGATTTRQIQYWYYLGGLDRIRGFADSRFSARYFVLSNSELRYVAIQKPNYIIQPVCFLDLAGLGEELLSVSQISAASTGLGVRVILPQFYRFVMRFDYALPLVKKDEMNFSFGVQQFF